MQTIHKTIKGVSGGNGGFNYRKFPEDYTQAIRYFSCIFKVVYCVWWVLDPVNGIVGDLVKQVIMQLLFVTIMNPQNWGAIAWAFEKTKQAGSAVGSAIGSSVASIVVYFTNKMSGGTSLIGAPVRWIMRLLSKLGNFLRPGERIKKMIATVMANGIVKNVTKIASTVKNWYGRILGAWMQIKMIVPGDWIFTLLKYGGFTGLVTGALAGCSFYGPTGAVAGGVGVALLSYGIPYVFMWCLGKLTGMQLPEGGPDGWRGGGLNAFVERSTGKWISLQPVTLETFFTAFYSTLIGGLCWLVSMQCTKDGFFNQLNIQDSMGGWGKVACDIFENIGVWAPLVFVVWELYQWYTSGACIHSVVKAYANRSSDDKQEVFNVLTKSKGSEAREVILANTISEVERAEYIKRNGQTENRSYFESEEGPVPKYKAVRVANSEAEEFS